MDEILANLRNMLNEAYIAAAEHIDATSMTPDERADAIAKDPEFRRAAEMWSNYVQRVRNRGPLMPPAQAPRGMLDHLINGRRSPNEQKSRPVPPTSAGVRG